MAALVLLIGTLADADWRDVLIAAIRDEVVQLVRDELRRELDLWRMEGRL